MQPQQPPANPYDFIVNPPKPPRQRLGSGLPMAARIGLVASGGVLLLIVVILLASSIFKSPSNVPNLTVVAQDQTEIVRVATRAATQAVDSDTRGFAQATSLSVATDLQQLLDFLSKHGTKLSSKKLGLGQKASTDQSLLVAQQASNYDTTFENIMQSYLGDYGNDLKTAFGSTQNGSERQLLSTQYQHDQLLLQQLQTLQDTSNN